MLRILLFCLFLITTKVFAIGIGCHEPYEHYELSSKISDLNLEIGNYEGAIVQLERDIEETINNVREAQETVNTLKQKEEGSSLSKEEDYRLAKAEHVVKYGNKDIEKLTGKLAELKVEYEQFTQSKDGLIKERAAIGYNSDKDDHGPCWEVKNF